MTPISFALEILLDCTTIEAAHKKARKFIKLHETTEVRIPGNMRISANATLGAIQQAPSTQRLLDAAPPPQPGPMTILGGEINNGDGTRGKRKW